MCRIARVAAGSISLAGSFAGVLLALGLGFLQRLLACLDLLLGAGDQLAVLGRGRDGGVGQQFRQRDLGLGQRGVRCGFGLLGGGAGRVGLQLRIANEEAAVRRFFGRLGDPSVLRSCYEAGPGGYDLYRLLTSMGVACDVVAPSLIPKGGSDTDKRDACRQARLHRAGELTPVRVPTQAEEAVRDLVRVRAALVDDRKRAQQRLTAVLMRHGSVWTGSYWTAAHRAWIDAQRFGEPALAAAIAHYVNY